jgi:hypothetical protein
LCFHSFFDWDSKGILLFPIFIREKEEFEKKCCRLEFAQQSVTKQENGNTRSASRPVSDSFRHIHRISSYATHKMTKRNKTGTFFAKVPFCIFFSIIR